MLNRIVLVVFLIGFATPMAVYGQAWETVYTIGHPSARHEAAFVAYNGRAYLIGGRGIKPVDVFDPVANTWTARAKTPIELHHFQAVVFQDAIYLIGAMTGEWPNEKPLEKIAVYYPDKDKFDFLHTVPTARRRGGAGAAVYNDKIYILGGITNGHMDGYKPWLDEYNPKTGAWRPLADAPHARDHLQAAVVENKLYSVAGRKTSQKTNSPFELTVPQCDVYDFETNLWSSRGVPDIPTPRAGNMVATFQGKVIVGGGESGVQLAAHKEIEIFDTRQDVWKIGPSLNSGRHGSGMAILGDYLYACAGCSNRGGEPELTSLERISLQSLFHNNLPQEFILQDHALTLNFKGPYTSEDATPNPFTDYRLQVEFSHVESGDQKVVRGFYASRHTMQHRTRILVRHRIPRCGEQSGLVLLRAGQSSRVVGTS